MKKRISVVLITLLIFAVSILPVCADAIHPARVVDNYGIFSEKELASLTEKLDKISEKHKVDVALLVIDDLNSSYMGGQYENFVDTYYDTMGYGMGENKDGILLAYFVEAEKNGHLQFCGYGVGADALNSSNEDELFDKIAPNVRSGDYLIAFTDYAEMCDGYIKDVTSYKPVPCLIISLVIGLVAAFIVTGIMRAQLKSVRKKTEATDYLKKGSLRITDSRDMFLYRDVKAIKKAKSTSSSTGSSGRAHSSGGRSL